jgi:hypothetical protein
VLLRRSAGEHVIDGQQRLTTLQVPHGATAAALDAVGKDALDQPHGSENSQKSWRR